MVRCGASFCRVPDRLTILCAALPTAAVTGREKDSNQLFHIYQGVVTMSASGSTRFEFVQQLARDLSGGKLELPPFPAVALRVRDALADPGVSVEKVARLVLSEPVLAARLLRIANSALMRRGLVEITDVRTVISHLGFTMVRSIVVMEAIDTAFKIPGHGLLHRRIEAVRRRSVRVAVLSCLLASKLVRGSVRTDDAMLAGLLHAIGCFYILIRADAFPAVFGHSDDELGELLEQWYPSVGRAIVESWGFPESFAVAVDEHTMLDREHRGKADLADVVLAAHLLAQRTEPEQSDGVDLATIPACVKLGLDEQTAVEVLLEAQGELRSMAEAFDG
jgi:HD-like signal output (HDOD) protein